MSVKKKTLKQLGYETLELDKIRKAPWNYKGEDDMKSAKLRNNIAANGQIENIIVRELGDGTYECVNGNHRLDAMNAIGFKYAVVCNKGSISLSESKRIAIETNETRFQTDVIKLAEVLDEISFDFNHEELEATMPFDEDDFHYFANRLEEHRNPIEKKEGKNNTPTEPKEKLQTLKIKMPEETYNTWVKWLERCKEQCNQKNTLQSFEFALINAMNLPDDKLVEIPDIDE